MEEQKMILTMLNEGKISAEEAEKLLKAIHQKKTFALPSTSLIKKEKPPKKGPTVGQRAGRLIGRVVNRIKTADFDLNFGESEPVHYVFDDENVLFENIEIDISNGAVKLIPWQEHDVKIECDADVYKIPEGTTAKTKFRNETFYDCDASHLRFYSKNKHQKVHATIYIPQKNYQQIKVTTFNGAITLENISCDELHMKATIGALALYQCRGHKLHVETASGGITLEEIVGHEVIAETMNGLVRMKGDVRHTRLETIHGSIQFRLETLESGYASLKTVTGKIEAELPSALRLHADLKTVVGSLVHDFPLAKILEEKKEVTRKTLKFSTNQENDWEYELEAETKTGSVIVKKAQEG
ncbi:hypothetical protein A374_02064 [Fictibacillus macauensis ZFHKF-1]|uniref:Uncharacterized protein n=1 Tax=Fictibacillus macauensis ZFHKF-1 TaxID=1196324 RepID=I8UJF9_9BACL|nr:DUF4097 family beta strand repeat-containing protein [Fictibacillus macauensis]EIT87000.1 hypothetical protein A374_02064 [Fictibacillus macauensis ZFHKF-1]